MLDNLKVLILLNQLLFLNLLSSVLKRVFHSLLLLSLLPLRLLHLSFLRLVFLLSRLQYPFLQLLMLELFLVHLLDQCFLLLLGHHFECQIATQPHDLGFFPCRSKLVYGLH